MKTLTFTKPHDLSQLHDEILVAIPALRPKDGPVMRVEGLGDQIFLYVPDAASEPAIQAVVNAHVPTQRVDGRLVTIRAIRDATTVAQLKAAMLAYIRADRQLEP